MFAAAVAVTLGVSSQKTNMNGDYTIANPLPGSDTTFSTNSWDYPGGVEYFDVYSPPITTHYSQVWWTMMQSVPIPEDIAKRFDGKVMAITGMEHDQVQKTPDGDVSVPITWQYNHHYGAYLQGKDSVMEKIKLTGPNDERNFMGHVMPGNEMWITRARNNDSNPTSKFPAATVFAEGNGGEFRKSFHSYPFPYAQLIESPVKWAIQPMQIDTQNRDGSMARPGMAFKSGITTRMSQAPKTGRDAVYSGLLECPCTDRITRTLGGASGSYTTQVYGHCASPLSTAAACESAVQKIAASAHGTVAGFVSISNSSAPAGCSLTATGAAAVSVRGVYNADSASQIVCGGPEGQKETRGAAPATAKSAGVGLSVHMQQSSGNVTIIMTGPADVWFGVGFGGASMGDLPYTIVVDGHGQVSEHKLANHAAGKALQPSIAVLSSAVAGATRTIQLLSLVACMLLNNPNPVIQVRIVLIVCISDHTAALKM